MRKPVLDVLQNRFPQRQPVWLMRQAGRYLPEYRDIRAKAKHFLNMCLTPEWATEITLQPIRRFDMDAAILFADILLIPLALGQGLEFREGEGPVLPPLTLQDLDRLHYDQSKLAPVFETVRRVRAALPESTALIGFCGSPWTVACYMIDGHSKNAFSAALGWIARQPHQLQRLIERLIEASDSYLSAQIDAGAEVIQLFDSWAGLLKGEDFTRYVIAPTRELVRRLKQKYPEIPVIGFPRQAADGYHAYIRETGVDAMSLDPSVDLAMARDQLQSIKILQGNLDPALLVQGGIDMRKAVERIQSVLGPRHLFNLGHGVVPQTPPEHVAELVRLVRAA